MTVCPISETKRTNKGTTTKGQYTLVYSQVGEHKRACVGVGTLINHSIINSVHDLTYIKERMISATMVMLKKKVQIVADYRPDTGRDRINREHFYDILQNTLNNIPHGDPGDFNGHIGNKPLAGVMQEFNEEAINESGQDLIEFWCAELTIYIFTIRRKTKSQGAIQGSSNL